MAMIRYCILAALFLAAGCQSEAKHLPIYGNRQTVEKTVDGKKMIDTIYQTIPAFQFLNQDSVLIDNHLFDGKIYVAAFFFTTCPSICPVMHRNMLKVYRKFQKSKEVMLLSHSIDFKYDVPHILKRYATKLGVTDQQWQFVHGSKEITYSLAQHNYLVSVSVDPKAPGGYVHQGYLVLIDKQKRVRGAYDGTVEAQVDQLMKDMDILLKEQ